MLKDFPHFTERLLTTQKVHVQQRIENLESVTGLEGNNFYYLLDQNQEALGYAKEVSTGFGKTILRWIFKHFRKFHITIQDQYHEIMIEVNSPIGLFKVFRVREFSTKKYAGQVKENFSILYRKLTIYDSKHRKMATVKAPRYRFWSFTIKGQKQLGKIDKKWSGVFSELLTDRDDFVITYSKGIDSLEHRILIIIATLMVDIVYFDNNPVASLPLDIVSEI